MNIPKTKLHRIVVVGGGFAGISLIKKLKRTAVQIVLFDKHNYHTFQPLLYQVSTAGLEPGSIAYPLRKIFKDNENFYFRLADVTNINTDKKFIETTIGSLGYDSLILATGTKTNYFGNKEIQSFSMPMKTIPQALNIRSLILQNMEKADISEDLDEQKRLLNFVIAGGGPTGVELAGALAEFKNGILENDYHELDGKNMCVHLLEGGDRLLAPMSLNASEKALKFLIDLGVNVHLNARVKDYDGIAVHVENGMKIRAATFIWAAGVTGAPVYGINKNALDEHTNRYRVDVYNKIEGIDSIYAIGDIALMKTSAFPMGHPQVAQPAIQQGRNLGRNIKRALVGKKMIAFKYVDKGTMATIGRNKAVVDINKWNFGGIFAWFLWMFVHLYFLVGFRNRFFTFFNWTFSYINYDRAARLIIRPFKKN